MKVGLLGNTYHPINNTGLVTGFLTASCDLMDGFLRHAKADKLVCLYEPGQYQEVKLQEMARISGMEERIQMVSEYDLLFHGTSLMPEVDILHSVKEDAIPLLALRESIGKPIPITYTVHSLAEQHLLLDTFLPTLFLPFKPYDAIICTSESVRSTIREVLNRCQDILARNLGDQVRNRPMIRLEKVPLGIDTDYFSPRDRAAGRDTYHIPQDAFVILWFGRFSDLFKADLYPLLHVFHQLLRKNPSKKLRLILAGCGDSVSNYETTLRKQIDYFHFGETVQILPSREIFDRAALYSACDVFTSPVDNIQETFGLTPIEAMACGVPQVVSDWDGYRDTVVDGETGFLIPTLWADCMDDVAGADYLPLDPRHRRLLQRHLAIRSVAVDCGIYEEKLQYLLDHPEICAEMGRASRQRAESCFSLKNTVEETERVWEGLLRIAEESPGVFVPDGIPMLDYCKDFRSYPTQMLGDDVSFTLTPHGRETPVSHLPQYRIFLKYAEEAAMPQEIVAFLSSAPGSVGQFHDANSRYTLSQIRRSFLFLKKYGMIHEC